MASSQSVLTALITLGREAVEAVASTGDMATLRGAALLNLAWGLDLPDTSVHGAAKDAIHAVPLAADRNGQEAKLVTG